MAWLSPAFPVGSFSYSHGLETAVHSVWVTDADSLREWLADLIEHGSAWNDAVLFADGPLAGPESPVLRCEVTGRLPGDPADLRVAHRRGLDLFPLDAADPAPRTAYPLVSRTPKTTYSLT